MGGGRETEAGPDRPTGGSLPSLQVPITAEGQGGEWSPRRVGVRRSCSLAQPEEPFQSVQWGAPSLHPPFLSPR